MAVWVSGGYKHDWIDEATAESLAAAACLVVQDLFHSPLMDRATYRLPGAAFAEREGSYVNDADRLQSVAWAIRPPAGVRVEGSVYWELAGSTGLVKPRRVLDEMADAHCLLRGCRRGRGTAGRRPVGSGAGRNGNHHLGTSDGLANTDAAAHLAAGEDRAADRRPDDGRRLPGAARAVDGRLDARPHWAQPRRHSAHQDQAVRSRPAAGRRAEVHLQGRVHPGPRRESALHARADR